MASSELKDDGTELKSYPPATAQSSAAYPTADRPTTPGEAPKPATGPPPAFQISYPNGLLQAVILVALLLAQFLVALDMSIIATAIPTITVKFHSVDQVGWYGSAFFGCLAAFQAFWGKAYKYFSLKTVFLTCTVIFEVGSMIVALAQNSTTVIVGRAIQGLGGAGVTGGCYVICAFITPPTRLPAIMGIFGTVWSCASVLGPVLGGVFTQDVSWRWCFWINLPIGAVTMLAIAIFFKTPAHSRLAKANPKDIPLVFDFPGIAFFLCSLVCLCLALQDGEVTRPWNSSVPIGLLVGFGLLLIVFALIEWQQGDRAMIPWSIMSRRSIAVCAIFSFLSNAAGFARVYNLPIYFQAVQGVSPSASGVRTLPSVLSISISSLVSSILLGRVGYYQPFLLIGGVFMTVGAGLIYTLAVHSPASQYIGYQIVAGIGMGLTIQVPAIVAQSISERKDLAVAVAISLFYQFVGGTIGVSAAQSIMTNQLLSDLPRHNPAISPARVLAAGASGLRRAFPNTNDLSAVVNAYLYGLKKAWIWSIALAGLAFLVAFLAEWKSIKAEDVNARKVARARTEDPASA
ncbi:hypothetical protein A1O1_04523 [Capronia coronata CBS 617.96]|uniref:Major facilitator superfamily (MFS) profile domain-containing protein n=1 Tax=Capronia coronata CBS 617.96 TaxID=1182541 RepID=W9YQA1_9EURO|nr:uncharacterized protein A1O1_04523 [Capronia coronata CBS 617.96]EXJ91411.1 hypothetical protein A1O1_04523 [Capronia coronata CBS 617.96]